MARPITLTKALEGGGNNDIAESQGPVTGNFTLDGDVVTDGVAILDTARRVIITSAGDDSGITFTVYGTNEYGNLIQETFAGANGVASSNLDFLTVTRISSSAATASTVIAGTNDVGSTPWVAVTAHIPTTQLSVAVAVTGTVNYTVEYTYQDVNYAPNSLFAYNRDNIVPTIWPDTLVQGLAVSAIAVQNDPVWAARVTINSGDGSISATFLQAGIAGP